MEHFISRGVGVRGVGVSVALATIVMEVNI